MSTWDTVDEYFSGQGVVLLAGRDSNGNPTGFEPVGNVSDLKISVATSVLEHKESKTGQRGTDLRLTTETKVSLSMTAENFVSENLARALRGTKNVIAAASAVAFGLNAYAGKVSSLPHIKVSAVAVKIGATTLDVYVNDATAWDYKVNLDAGSIQFNDGSLTVPSKLGLTPTGVTVGTTTTITVANTLAAGDSVYLYGFAGADAAQLNNQTFTVLSATGSAFVISLDTTGDTITFATAKVLPKSKPVAVTVDYSYTSQARVDSLTLGAQDLFMRFEGLNTAKTNEPVIVNVFKFSTDPLKELSLIADTVQQFVLEGSVLLDSTRSTGSKYFEVLKAA